MSNSIQKQLYQMISAKGLPGRDGLELAEDLHDAGYRPIGGIIQMLRNEDEEPYEILYFRLKRELENLWNAD